MAQENPGRGCRRLQGELPALLADSAGLALLVVLDTRPDVFHLTVDTSSTGRSPSATANGGGPRGKLQVARGCA